MIYITFRSAFVTLLGGGVTWRGTHYSLKDLKEGRRCFRAQCNVAQRRSESARWRRPCRVTPLAVNVDFVRHLDLEPLHKVARMVKVARAALLILLDRIESRLSPILVYLREPGL